MCSYIHKLTQNLTETFRTSIYIRKNTKHTKFNFRRSHLSKIIMFQRLDIQHKSAFYADLYCTTNILHISTMIVVVGHTSLVFNLANLGGSCIVYRCGAMEYGRIWPVGDALLNRCLPKF